MKHSSHIVLLVEDDPDDVMLIREVFSNNLDYKLVHEKNGLEAVNYLKELKAKNFPMPCLIITDINMPVLDGKKLLSILKNEKDFQSIPVIVFTTSSSDEDKEFCKRFHVPMVTKPYDMKIFNETVHEFLDHCEAA